MPIGQRTPGPIHAFVRFRGQSSAIYLGSAVTSIEPESEKFKLEVMNDLGGRSVPFQLIQDGEKGTVPLILNRFNYNVVMNIRALESGVLPTGGSTGRPPGLGNETGLARGSLVLGVSDFELVLLNQYFGTLSAGIFTGGITESDLAPGRYYYSCNLRKYKESTVGTRVLEVALIVECQNLYDTLGRGFSLYTEVPTSFPPGATLTAVV